MKSLLSVLPSFVVAVFAVSRGGERGATDICGVRYLFFNDD